ncbi:transposase [Pandoraea cepalis]|uniref:Transposase n=1 Tax=Pandoraea cepalis TaxID=2508294 RepID=A0A5E4Y5R6_9BURK|nr:IS30 family transposase [Pandoraea cepalis]VVE43718.1 transposase [Pandoraea cepalis]
MKKNYRHLSAEERAVIMIEHTKDTSAMAIARMLGRATSTVTRELKRNCETASAHYDATHAAWAYRTRREHCVRRRKLISGSPLYQHVHNRLVYWRWSPQQIAAGLRRMYPHDPDQRISHETIYAAIYAHPRGGLKQAMIDALRQEKPARGRRRTSLAQRSFVPEDLRIMYRPEQIELRQWPGHWEGDLIKGAFNRSCVGTLVERKTRFVVLCRMGGCKAQDALEGFTRQMKKLPAFLRESLTYDRGTEMTCHVELSNRLNLDIWFADPYAPWQRGSNENTNGLLRQFLPKGMDLSSVSQIQFNDITKLLNGRPRQTLGWDTPEEAVAKELGAAGLAQRCT